MKFHGNPSSWSGADSCRQTDEHEEADMRCSFLGK